MVKQLCLLSSPASAVLSLPFEAEPLTFLAANIITGHSGKYREPTGAAQARGKTSASEPKAKPEARARERVGKP